MLIICSNEPFTIAAERLLARMLSAAGLSPDIIIVKPEELSLHTPTVVVVCGEQALLALSNLKDIHNRRGSVYRSDNGYWLVPIIHPTKIYQNALWQEIPISVRILERAQFLLAHYHPHTWHEQVGGADEVQDFITMLYEGDRWSLDLETIPGPKPVIRLLGLAGVFAGQTRAFCCPWPGQRVWTALKPLVETCQSRLVGHNLLYDATWLWEQGIKITEPFMDTMQSFHQCHAELPKGLDFVTMWYLGKDIPYYKDEGLHHKKHPTFEEQARYYQYCMKDCVACLWASYEIEKEPTFVSPTWDTWNIALQMNRQGIEIAPETVRQFLDWLVEEIAIRQAIIQQQIPNLNINSPIQIQHLFYDVLKLRKQTIGGRATIGEEALRQLMVRYPQQPLIQSLLEIRKLEKIRRDYVSL